MLAQMANYPSASQPEPQQYNAFYPAAPGAQQLMESQDQLQYSSINPQLYPKAESAPSEQEAGNQHMHHLTSGLHQHTSIAEQQQQHLAHAAQQMQHSTPHGTPAHLPQLMTGSSQPTPDSASQKPNRLRKACDSCSIRKVKVRI